VTWLSAGAWDPCNFATTKPIRSVEDLKGLRVYTFPTGGQFISRLGVVPVTLPWEDIEVALQTGEIDGIAWCGATETYTVGWADVTKYYLTNNISGAWSGSFFANTDKWNAVPDHLKTLFQLAMDSSHYYRQHWYWWGEAHYRTTGGKLELTTIPEEEWKGVEDMAMEFWDEIAAKSERNAKVVEILKKYQDTMRKAGAPYRYG
jgi:TRAP-type mannitol/chloroaromatic compound transport system substrate-binding protein